MKKTIFTFALALTAIVAGARVYVPGEDLEYVYNDETKTATVVQCRSTWKVDTYHIDYYNTYSGDIVIPETAPNGYTVVAIGDNAFQRLNDSRFDGTPPTISSISIPKTVKTIGNYAFKNCNLLTTFTIPATVEEIGNCVFDGSAITTITIEDTETPLIIGGGTMSNINVFGSDGALTTVYAGRDLTPKSTQNLGPFQFAAAITNITYGPKVTKLNKHEFWRSTSIKNVIILSTQITDIPEGAFGECSSLETVELPQSIVTIQNTAFIWCKELRNIVLPPMLKTIGNQAFDGCRLTPEFTIPASVEEIGYVAFRSSGITHLTIKDSETPLTIGYGGTTDITMFGSMFSQPCTIYAGRDITYSGDFGPFCRARNISEITYGPKVTKLNYYEAQSCESLEKVVCLSEKITEIPEAAFANCSKLVSVQLPARLETIGKQAFTSTALTTVTIPATVKNIYDFAFISSPLETINAMPTWPPLCVYNVFANGVNRTIYDNCRLMVPKGSLEDYKAADVWKEFFSIEEMGETKCARPTATLQNGHLKFSCETKGVTFHYEYSYPEGGKGEGDDVAILQTVTVSVYASRADLEDSDVAIYELTIAGGGSSSGDVNGDGIVDVADIATIIDIMAKN